MTSTDVDGRNRRRRSAPLSLYHLLDPEVLANPYPLYRRLRERGPRALGPVPARLGRHALRTTSAPSSGGSPPTARPTPGVLRGPRGARGRAHRPGDGQADAVHGRARAHPAPAAGRRRRSSRSRSSSCAPHIQDIADRLIDGVLARGADRMDLMADFAEPLPAIVTAELLGRPGRGPRRAQGVVGHVRRDAGQLPAQPGPARRRAARPSRT